MILANDDVFIIPLCSCLFMGNNFPSSYSFKVCMWFAMSFRYYCVWMAHFSQRQKVRHHNWLDVRFSQNPFGMCNYWKLLLGKVLISIRGRRNYTFPFSVAARAVTADRKERERVRGACFGGGEASPIDVLSDSDTLRSNYCAVIRATRLEAYGSFL